MNKIVKTIGFGIMYVLSPFIIVFALIIGLIMYIAAWMLFPLAYVAAKSEESKQSKLDVTANILTINHENGNEKVG